MAAETGAIVGPPMAEALASTHAREAAELVRSHAHRAALGMLAFDLLSRQAQARTLFSGKEFVEARAREHQVQREQGETPWGNLLAVLERGPQTGAERALVLAFAVDGLRQRLEDVGAQGRDAALARFAGHADWLVLSTPLDPYPLVHELLDDRAREALWGRLAAAVLEEGSPDPACRARHAARLVVLRASADASAEVALRRVADQCSDALVAGWAQEALPGSGGSSSMAAGKDALTVRGSVGRAPCASARDVLRIVSGVAAIEWVLRAVGHLAGFRREAEVALVDGGVRVHRRTRLLGRTVRDGQETYTLAAVAGAGRLVRYPAVHLLVGLLALSVGILLGGLWLFEGIRSGETVLLLMAAGVILIGAGLDLTLAVLVPGNRGRVALDLRVLSGGGVRLLRVPLAEADRFLEALARRLAPAGRGR
jgi:hypothetical protein